MLRLRVVIALVKLEILKAIHNKACWLLFDWLVVIALVKLEILKAIHNSISYVMRTIALLLH